MGYTGCNSSHAVKYKYWQIALSRRFTAIKLWIVIRRYGLANLMDHTCSKCQSVHNVQTFEEDSGQPSIQNPE
ncbi:hypothetical protein WN943_016472 [Citrus x changshan-huyou]